MKKNDEGLLSFESDLSSVIPAESVLLDTVVGDLRLLQEELTDVIKIVSKEAEALEKAGKAPKLTLAELIEQKSLVQNVGGVPQFNKITHLTGRTSMERFSMNAQVACEQAIESVENVKTKYLLVLGYFGEDETMSTGDFFGILRRFMAEWKKATLQVEKIERLQVRIRTSLLVLISPTFELFLIVVLLFLRRKKRNERKEEQRKKRRRLKRQQKLLPTHRGEYLLNLLRELL